MWVDTHAHLNFKAFAEDWREVVERAVAAGVEKIIVVGADLASSQRAVELAQENKVLYAAVGIHPHHARSINSIKSVKSIKELARRPKVVAIGEIGLDYHIYKNSKYEVKELDKHLQKKLFEMQLEVAQELDKPVIIHSREAGEEVSEIARAARGVFHCFGGSKKYLKKILAAGFYVGFTGQITYVPDRAAVAREVPLERLLIETDCPYMPPFAKATGGKPRRSEPRDVTIIGQFLGGETEQATTANARRLFGI
jgi:TatD DNase family protein